MIAFEFPYPPSVNTYYRANGNRRFITKRGINFREIVSEKVAEIAQDTINHEIHMEICLYPPDKRKRDIDNPLKALLDAMQEAGVYEDDSLIKKLIVEMRSPTKGGKCCVVILKGE